MVEPLEKIIEDLVDQLDQDDFTDWHNNLGPCECRKCFDRKLCSNVRATLYQEIIDMLQEWNEKGIRRK